VACFRRAQRCFQFERNFSYAWRGAASRRVQSTAERGGYKSSASPAARKAAPCHPHSYSWIRYFGRWRNSGVPQTAKSTRTRKDKREKRKRERKRQRGNRSGIDGGSPLESRKRSTMQTLIISSCNNSYRKTDSRARILARIETTHREEENTSVDSPQGSPVKRIRESSPSRRRTAGEDGEQKTREREQRTSASRLACRGYNRPRV